MFAYASESIVDVGPAVAAMETALPIVLGIGALLVLISVAGSVVWVVTRSLTR